jgi:hypothetical protein
MLDARVDRLEATLERLANAQAQTQADLRTLVVAVKNLADAVGDLKGDQLERDHREHADAYFAPLLNRLRVLSVEERSSLAADARDAGRLSPEEAHNLLQSDLILRGKGAIGSDLFLVVEVSSVIDSRDVTRAARRAQLLATATGLPVRSGVAGKQTTSEAAAEASAQDVWQIIDSQVTEPRSPGGPLRALTRSIDPLPRSSPARPTGADPFHAFGYPSGEVRHGTAPQAHQSRRTRPHTH